MSNIWRGTAKIDASLLVRRDRGDSPYVTFPVRCPDGDNCALPLGHLCEHISIDEAWDALERKKAPDREGSGV